MRIYMHTTAFVTGGKRDAYIKASIICNFSFAYLKRASTSHHPLCIMYIIMSGNRR